MGCAQIKKTQSSNQKGQESFTRQAQQNYRSCDTKIQKHIETEMNIKDNPIVKRRRKTEEIFDRPTFLQRNK